MFVCVVLGLFRFCCFCVVFFLYVFRYGLLAVPDIILKSVLK